jgi:hypothetical protein
VAQAIVGDPAETWYLQARDGAGLTVSATAPQTPPAASAEAIPPATPAQAAAQPAPVAPGPHASRAGFTTPTSQAAAQQPWARVGRSGNPDDEAFVGTGERLDSLAAALGGTVTQTPSAAAASGQEKTLRCQDCGEMNYPTEWYCERCGGELAAL